MALPITETTNFVTVTTTNVVTVTNAVISNIDGLEVVKKVNDFYTTSFGFAFGHICQLLTWLIAILGITVPILFYFFQKFQFDLKEKKLEKRLSEFFKQEIAKVDAELRKQNGISFKAERDTSQEHFNKLEKRIDNDLERAKGGIFHVQGITALQAGHYIHSLKSFTRAMEHNLQGNAFENIKTTMSAIQANVLPKLNKKDFSEPKIEQEFRAVLEAIAKATPHSLLDKEIGQIKGALDEAQKREAK